MKFNPHAPFRIRTTMIKIWPTIRIKRVRFTICCGELTSSEYYVESFSSPLLDVSSFGGCESTRSISPNSLASSGDKKLSLSRASSEKAVKIKDRTHKNVVRKKNVAKTGCDQSRTKMVVHQRQMTGFIHTSAEYNYQKCFWKSCLYCYSEQLPFDSLWEFTICTKIIPAKYSRSCIQLT